MVSASRVGPIELSQIEVNRPNLCIPKWTSFGDQVAPSLGHNCIEQFPASGQILEEGTDGMGDGWIRLAHPGTRLCRATTNKQCSLWELALHFP